MKEGDMSIISLLIEIAILICFFFLCSNVSKILRYIRKIYLFEKIRMIEGGLIDPQKNTIIKWQFNENDEAIERGNSKLDFK